MIRRNSRASGWCDQARRDVLGLTPMLWKANTVWTITTLRGLSVCRRSFVMQRINPGLTGFNVSRFDSQQWTRASCSAKNPMGRLMVLLSLSLSLSWSSCEMWDVVVRVLMTSRTNSWRDGRILRGIYWVRDMLVWFCSRTDCVQDVQANRLATNSWRLYGSVTVGLDPRKSDFIHDD